MSTTLSPTKPMPPKTPARPGRITRALLFVFGPAQLGDPNEPPPPARPEPPPCPGCHGPMAGHTYVETPERRRLRCPV
jgi:hypothetical protein